MCWKGYSFSIEGYRLGNLIENHFGHRCLVLLMDSQFIPRIYIFSASKSCLPLVSGQFWNWEMWIFLFFYCFGYSGSFVIPYKLWNQLVNFYKAMYWDSDRHCIKYINQNREHRDLHSINSFDLWTWDFSPLIRSWISFSNFLYFSEYTFTLPCYIYF